LRHFFSYLSKTRAFSRRHIEHFQPFTAQADFIQYFLGSLYSLPGAQVALGEMTTALQAASHKNAIRAVFESFQNVQDINGARTRQFDDADISWILQAHYTRQVSGGIRAVVTGKCHDLRFKWLVIFYKLSQVIILSFINHSADIKKFQISFHRAAAI
jgi:hypothetical protein